MGKTPSSGSYMSWLWKHPHMHGEDIKGEVVTTVERETPPHAWGRLSHTQMNIIRKVTPAGVVTTLAGLQGVSGADDGTGSLALFNQPSGLVLDGAGNLYATDTGNSTIRKITPAGVVSTLAGLPTIGGNQDGTGSGAMFNQPRALTIDSAGNLYVTDTGNATIRKVTPAGVVTTLTLRQGTASAGTGGGSTGGGSTPASSGSSANAGPNGNGAGATEGWFVAGLGLLTLLRRARPRR